MTTVETGLRYDPAATYEVKSRDIEYRRDGSLPLLARIYQPRGAGPFPALLSVHGGAWAGKDWLLLEPSYQKLSEGGLVVTAIQFRTSQDAPHPAAMQDISYATRWLKAHAHEFNASSERVGGAGWSSGGHQIMLSAMRPREYAQIPLPAALEIEATLDYVIMGWPVIDPLSRFRFAQAGEARPLSGDLPSFIQRHLAYFIDEAGMAEANPQLILERGESVDLPPALIVQGAADAQITPGMAEKFVAAYSAAGGVIELGKYPGEPHGFIRQGGPNAMRAIAQIKSFIARQLAG